MLLNKLNSSFVNNNKIFWKNIEPFILDQGKNTSRITLCKSNGLFLVIPKPLKYLTLFLKVLFCHYALQTCHLI